MCPWLALCSLGYTYGCLNLSVKNKSDISTSQYGHNFKTRGQSQGGIYRRNSDKVYLNVSRWRLQLPSSLPHVSNHTKTIPQMSYFILQAPFLSQNSIALHVSSTSCPEKALGGGGTLWLVDLASWCWSRRRSCPCWCERAFEELHFLRTTNAL